METPNPSRRHRSGGYELVSIFEAINATTREVYVGTTRGSLDALAREHAQARPYAIAHWKARQRVGYQYVAYAIREREAGAYIRRYVRSFRKPGWTFVTDATSQG